MSTWGGDWNSLDWTTKAPSKIFCYVKVDGVMQKYCVDTGDCHEARSAVIRHLDQGFKKHGAVLALVPG